MIGKFLPMLLVVLMGVTGEAQRGPGHGDGRGGPHRPGDRRPDRDTELVAYLNQSIRGYGSINLNYELKLDQIRGRKIEDVILVASAREDRFDRRRRGPPADAILRVDNRTIGYAQRISDRAMEISLAKNMNLEMGRNCSNLAIDIRGSDVLVHQVIIVVDNERGRGRTRDGLISQTINHSVRRGDDLNLNYMLKLDPQEAQQVEAIVVRARGMEMRSSSSIQAVVEQSSSQIQFLSSDMREFTLYLPRDRFGRDLRNIRLIVRGDSFIESVGVKLSRR